MPPGRHASQLLIAWDIALTPRENNLRSFFRIFRCFFPQGLSLDFKQFCWKYNPKPYGQQLLKLFCSWDRTVKARNTRRRRILGSEIHCVCEMYMHALCNTMGCPAYAACVLMYSMRGTVCTNRTRRVHGACNICGSEMVSSWWHLWYVSLMQTNNTYVCIYIYKIYINRNKVCKSNACHQFWQEGGGLHRTGIGLRTCKPLSFDFSGLVDKSHKIWICMYVCMYK